MPQDQRGFHHEVGYPTMLEIVNIRTTYSNRTDLDEILIGTRYRSAFLDYGEPARTEQLDAAIHFHHVSFTSSQSILGHCRSSELLVLASMKPSIPRSEATAARSGFRVTAMTRAPVGPANCSTAAPFGQPRLYRTPQPPCPGRSDKKAGTPLATQAPAILGRFDWQTPYALTAITTSPEPDSVLATSAERNTPDSTSPVCSRRILHHRYALGA